MSFNTNTGRAEYIASTGQTLFPFVFKIFNDTDLKVYKTLANATPNETNDLLILNTDYTVTIDGDAGGSITLLSVASINDAITLVRDLPTTREIEYQTSGDLLAETLNDDQEYQTYLLADNKQISNRTLVFEENLQGMDNVLPTPEALRLLRWNSTGKALENTVVADDGIFVNIFNIDSIAELLLINPLIYSTVNIRGYYTANDGGGGLFNYDSSQSATNNGGTIINGWIRQYDGTVNVKWFGAKGDNIADDTISINLALSATYNTRETAYIPGGDYRYSGGGDLGNGNIIKGDGRGATNIIAISASPTYLFKCAGYGAGLRDLRFTAEIAQTGGSWILLQAPESFIEHFFMDGDYNGILMTANVGRIQHGRFQDGATGAIRIKAEGGDNSQIIDDVLMGAQTPPNVASAGIRVRNNAALMITNTSVIQQGVGLLIDPTDSSESVLSLYANNCFFDNGTYGIRIIPTGTGGVYRCRFANVWCGSSSSDGVLLNGNVIQGMHFESCHAVLNAGSGIAIGNGCSDIAIIGGEFCANNYGVFCSNALTKLKIQGATIGAGAGLSGNTNEAIVLNVAGIDEIVITDNILTGNGATITDSSTGSNKHITDNIGYKTKNYGQANVTWDGAGQAIIAHGLVAAPNFYTADTLNGGAIEAQIISADATNITIRGRNTIDNSNAGGSYLIKWFTEI